MRLDALKARHSFKIVVIAIDTAHLINTIGVMFIDDVMVCKLRMLTVVKKFMTDL